MLPLGLMACSDLQPEGVVNDEDPLTALNGISSNGISSNGISSNGISSNALTSNALSSGSLPGNAALMNPLRDGTSTGDLSRMFFRYVVNCALPAGKSVTYNWTDAVGVLHTEINPGGLGLAPQWETGGIDTNAKELVSACLGARTNALGVTVPISLRSKATSVLAVSAQERSDYAYGEGAFWGNVFNNGSPYLYACTRSPFKGGAPSSQYTGHGRTCTTGGCGIIRSVGSCYNYDFAALGQACYDRAALAGGVSDDVSNCFTTGANTLVGGSTHVISTWLLP